jgi:hypothetical protein
LHDHTLKITSGAINRFPIKVTLVWSFPPWTADLDNIVVRWHREVANMIEELLDRLRATQNGEAGHGDVLRLVDFAFLDLGDLAVEVCDDSIAVRCKVIR